MHHQHSNPSCKYHSNCNVPVPEHRAVGDSEVYTSLSKQLIWACQLQTPGLRNPSTNARSIVELVDGATDRGCSANVCGGGVCWCGIVNAVHADVAGRELCSFVDAAVGVHVEDVGRVGEAHDDLLDAAVLKIGHGNREVQQVGLLSPVRLRLDLNSRHTVRCTLIYTVS